MLYSYSTTSVGQLRDKNEDNYLDGIQIGDLHVVAVADGMGGHQGGDVASKLAIESIHDYVHQEAEGLNFFDDLSAEQMCELARSAVKEGNQRIMNYKEQFGLYPDMGTTLTAVFIWQENLITAHVGDSRAYLIHNNSIKQLTEDHSLVNQLYRRGELTLEAAQNHPQKNILTRALGLSEEITVDVTLFDLPANSIVVLCTDGLTHHLDDSEIMATILKARDIESASKQLIELSNTRGGHDNVTVCLLAKGRLADISRGETK